jgi:hypothetical protein
MPALRDYQLRLINTFPPKSVTINEEKISYSANSADSSYTYDGGEVTTVIYTGKQDVNKKITIIIEHDNADPAMLSGVKGKLKHLRNFVDFVGRGPEPLYQYEPVVSTALTGLKITYDPAKAVELIYNFKNEYQNALEIVKIKKAEETNWDPYLEWLQID